jgi:hypothetical protein
MSSVGRPRSQELLDRARRGDREASGSGGPSNRISVADSGACARSPRIVAIRSLEKTMRNGTKTAVLFAALALLFGGVGEVGASVVYDGGPINGTIGSYSIGPYSASSNSFRVTSAATLTGAQHVGVWLFPFSDLRSLDWSIGTSPLASDISSGSASVSGTGLDGYGHPLYDANFPISGVVVPGITYWFTLKNAVSYGFGGPQDAGWDINNGPSTATNYWWETLPGASFQLIGDTAAVPEPTALLVWSGLGAIGAVIAHRRKRRAA